MCVEVKSDEEALVQVCGGGEHGEAMAARVKLFWDDMMEKKRLDVSGQNLNDDDVKFLLKGLHMCAAR